MKVIPRPIEWDRVEKDGHTGVVVPIPPSPKCLVYDPATESWSTTSGAEVFVPLVRVIPNQGELVVAACMAAAFAAAVKVGYDDRKLERLYLLYQPVKPSEVDGAYRFGLYLL